VGGDAIGSVAAGGDVADADAAGDAGAVVAASGDTVGGDAAGGDAAGADAMGSAAAMCNPAGADAASADAAGCDAMACVAADATAAAGDASGAACADVAGADVAGGDVAGSAEARGEVAGGNPTGTDAAACVAELRVAALIGATVGFVVFWDALLDGVEMAATVSRFDTLDGRGDDFEGFASSTGRFGLAGAPAGLAGAGRGGCKCSLARSSFSGSMRSSEADSPGRDPADCGSPAAADVVSPPTARDSLDGNASRGVSTGRSGRSGSGSGSGRDLESIMCEYDLRQTRPRSCNGGRRKPTCPLTDRTRPFRES